LMRATIFAGGKQTFVCHRKKRGKDRFITGSDAELGKEREKVVQTRSAYVQKYLMEKRIQKKKGPGRGGGKTQVVRKTETTPLSRVWRAKQAALRKEGSDWGEKSLCEIAKAFITGDIGQPRFCDVSRGSPPSRGEGTSSLMQKKRDFCA